MPTRTEVPEYQALQQAVNEMVGRINGRYATVDYTPIILWHRSVSFVDLVRLYRMASVCLVTSCRDGMNLVSYEYVACRQQDPGVLILSEFAGASQSLNGSTLP